MRLACFFGVEWLFFTLRYCENLLVFLCVASLCKRTTCNVCFVRVRVCVYVCVCLSVGTLSCTHSKVIHKVDIPAMDWPCATFPQLKYPLEEHESENKMAEQKALEEVKTSERAQNRQKK